MAQVDVAASAASDFAATVEQLLEGTAAPILLFGYAAGWNDVQSLTSTVQGRLRPDQMPARAHWKGPAADRYVAAITTQSLAAGRLATIGSSTAGYLSVCAAAGLAFYAAVGAIIIQVSESLVAAAIALGSLVFSWAGVLLALGEVTIGAGTIWAAATALAAVLGVQEVQLAGLRSQTVDQSLFPGGHWPSAVTGTYSDATVTDNDADWSTTT